MNQYAIEIIKRFEGIRLKAYKDSVGVITIAYGHTLGVKMGDLITQEQADLFLAQDLEKFKADLDKIVTVIIDEFEEAALLSFIYNLGPNVLKTSTLLKLLNNQQPELAANEFTKFCYAGGKKIKGLELRRIAEKELFLRTS